MKKAAFYLFLILIIISFSACEDRVFDSVDETTGLKKGSKSPTDVQFGDLYGDLVEVEINDSGVPVLYPLRYRADFQDNVVQGIIDVANPRLTGTFDLTIFVRDDDGYVIMDPPTIGEDLVPRTTQVTIVPGAEGFISNFSPIVLYDVEGEILETVTEHVIPVEQGRLNLIRSSPDVLTRRMTEVIKNFGDGTVAAVVRDFCGRFYMVRTQAALDLGIGDKPIDSPLENMAVYKELMLYGFDRPVAQGGLDFLVDENIFHFQTKVDKNWGLYPYDYFQSLVTKQSIVMNLAASCIAAASDKSGSLKLDEILLVNRFLGIPKPIFGNGINSPATEVVSFFPYVEQEIRMMDKTNKSEYKKYRYYINYYDNINDPEDDYSFYTRDKFEETKVDFYTWDEVDGSIVKKHIAVFSLHDILLEITSPSLPDYITDANRYSEKDVFKNALGFANQADDYVQALAVIHNNEEFLEWQMPTPTWISLENSPFSRDTSPFSYTPAENEGGNGGGGKGGKGGKR